VVADLDGDGAVVAPQADLDRGARRRVHERVPDQVADTWSSTPRERSSGWPLEGWARE
jgi:hypothetical protein